MPGRKLMKEEAVGSSESIQLNWRPSRTCHVSTPSSSPRCDGIIWLHKRFLFFCCTQEYLPILFARHHAFPVVVVPSTKSTIRISMCNGASNVTLVCYSVLLTPSSPKDLKLKASSHAWSIPLVARFRLLADSIQ